MYHLQANGRSQACGMHDVSRTKRQWDASVLCKDQDEEFDALKEEKETEHNIKMCALLSLTWRAQPLQVFKWGYFSIFFLISWIFHLRTLVWPHKYPYKNHILSPQSLSRIQDPCNRGHLSKLQSARLAANLSSILRPAPLTMRGSEEYYIYSTANSQRIHIIHQISSNIVKKLETKHKAQRKHSDSDTMEDYHCKCKPISFLKLANTPRPQIK